MGLGPLMPPGRGQEDFPDAVAMDRSGCPFIPQFEAGASTGLGFAAAVDGV